MVQNHFVNDLATPMVYQKEQTVFMTKMQSDLAAVILMKIFSLAQMAAMIQELGMDVKDVNAAKEMKLELEYLVKE